MTRHYPPTPTPAKGSLEISRAQGSLALCGKRSSQRSGGHWSCVEREAARGPGIDGLLGYDKWPGQLVRILNGKKENWWVRGKEF